MLRAIDAKESIGFCLCLRLSFPFYVVYCFVFFTFFTPFITFFVSGTVMCLPWPPLKRTKDIQ